MDFVDKSELIRREVLARLNSEEQTELAQYFTPIEVANIMASMADLPKSPKIKILDPGAGTGILSTALVSRLKAEIPNLEIELVVVEKSETLIKPLQQTMNLLERELGVKTRIENYDFIEWGLRCQDEFDFIILNPPYKKLASASQTQSQLRKAGITVPNIYAAFLEIGASLLAREGQQISITPRSWMNGTYYEKFRKKLVSNYRIAKIHTFESRSNVFGESDVLQESAILTLRNDSRQSPVTIYESMDQFVKPSKTIVDYQDVVSTDFIFVPTGDASIELLKSIGKLELSLADLGLSVSTGKVVAFRSKGKITEVATNYTVPFLSASNLAQLKVLHPVTVKRKPQWYAAPDSGDSELTPPGTYVLVKRFSTKEETRRLIAGLWDCESNFAIDNKVNFIHQSGAGLDQTLAKGITVFLSSASIDQYFRVFSGHTQVNASDLRQMRFPSHKHLVRLANFFEKSQEARDKAIKELLKREGKN
jgi:adenine-specific DNA-methyltransferase